MASSVFVDLKNDDVDIYDSEKRKKYIYIFNNNSENVSG